MAASLLRERDGHHARVAPVELFFDLVFVFAITQLSHYLLSHLTPIGILQTLLVTAGVWWVWIYTSWVTNWLDPDRIPVRALLFALMAAALVMAMAIDDAWAGRGLAFAIAYVFIQVGRSLFMLAALYRHNHANYCNFIRISIWLAASGLLWLAGGFADGQTRLWLWLAAIVIEYAGPPLYFYVPGIGRSSTTDWDIEGAHIAERCGLFIIIALGESIIITGGTAARLPWNAETILAFGAAFLGTVAMWWIYFHVGAGRASDRISATRDPGRFARLVYNYLHLPIVAGILASAAADELVLGHPDGHLEPLQLGLVLGGPALFLIGNLLFKRTTASFFALSHLIGLGLLAILVPLAPHATPLALALATAGILLLVAGWETMSLRTSTAAAKG